MRYNISLLNTLPLLQNVYPMEFLCFFKQNTAYDMRINDWSSDVCSSDLRLVSPAELEEIIDNSCAQYFLFALYAIIPVQELIDIDLKKPMTFSSAAVASYNPFSGTFHEVRVNRPITVTPKEDRKSTRLNSSH